MSYSNNLSRISLVPFRTFGTLIPQGNWSGTVFGRFLQQTGSNRKQRSKTVHLHRKEADRYFGGGCISRTAGLGLDICSEVLQILITSFSQKS